MAHRQGRLRHDMKRHPSTQRVAEQVAGLVAEGGPDRFGHQLGGRRQVGSHGVRSAVAGKVHRHQRVRFGEVLSEATPQPSRLRESVQHHQRRPRTAHLEHGVARRVSVQATFSATLVDEWARLGVTDAVICPGSRSTPLALALAERLRTHVRLDERSGAFFALGLAMATGRPTVICVTSGTAAAELHPAVVEAHQARVPLIVCTADRPPELHDTGAPQTIEQVGLFASADCAGRLRPACPPTDRRRPGGPWPSGPLPSRSRVDRARAGPPQPRVPRAPDRDGHGAATAPGPGIVVAAGSTVHSRWRNRCAAGGSSSSGAMPAASGPRPRARHSRSGSAGRSWPTRGREAGWQGRSPPPIRSSARSHRCRRRVVMLGTPWLSRALGEYVSRRGPRRRTGRRRRSVAAVGGSQPGGDRVPSLRNGCLADRSAGGASPCDPEWLGLVAVREETAQAAIDGVLGADLSEPQVARAVHSYAGRAVPPSWCRRPCPSAISSGSPRRWRSARGCWPTGASTGSTASSRPHWASPPRVGRRSPAPSPCSVTWPSCTTSRGWSTCPTSPAPSSSSTTAGEGSSRSLPQAASLERGLFEQLFGTPPTSDMAAVARGFGLPVHEVTLVVRNSSHALAAPASRRWCG